MEPDGRRGELGHPYQDSIKPAEITYCGGYWIFSHDYIWRSRKDKVSGCVCVGYLAVTFQCIV